jgi:hypothetical protein
MVPLEERRGVCGQAAFWALRGWAHYFKSFCRDAL